MAVTGVINLDFERGILQGRNDESAVILKAYDSSLKSSCSVYIRGASGTGKSTLVRTTLQGLNNSTLFVQGKFDRQLGAKRPHGAFARALSELSVLAFAMENADLDRDIALLLIGQQEQCSVLLKVIPNLHQFITRHQKVNGEVVSEESSPTPALSTSRRLSASIQLLAWSSEKLKMDLRAIISIVTAYSAVVLFLDDLQWADRASMDIIQFLQESQHLSAFLLVGAHRYDDTSEANTPIQHRLANLLVTGHAFSISLQNFDLHCLNSILSSIVQCDTKETLPLTEVVFQKTKGNIFHVLQLLQWIQKPNMLFYSFTRLKWEWNLRNIQCGTEMHGDVVRLVGAAFISLSDDALVRLKVAACLGHEFDASAINGMVDTWNLTAEKGLKSKRPRHGAAWEEACSACIINPLAGQEGIRYEFSHDQFQQVAMDLIKDESERLRLHHHIGHFLVERFHQSDTSEEGWILLAAVDQLNKSIPLITDKKEILTLAKLNLEAAERVALRSAFFSASVLLSTGLVLLGEHKWADHYELALCMTIKSAKSEYCCGRHELCQMRSEEILIHARSIEDKAGVYATYLDSMLAENKAGEVLEVGFELLQQIGFSFPKRVGTFRINREYLHVKKLLKRRTDDELVSGLPAMTDWKSQQAVKLLTALIVPAWLSDQIEVFALIVIRMTNLTLMYGATPYSGMAYSSFGVVLAKFSHLKQAKRMGNLGLKMQDRFREVNNCMEAETMFVTATTLAHLTRPLHDLLDMELKSHDSGFETGDLKAATGASMVYIVTYYHCGLPLKVLIEDAAKFADEMEEYSQQTVLVDLLFYRQAALNLMGKSDDPLLLQGDAIPDLKVVLHNEGSGQAFHRKQQVYTLLMMQLCFFMGDLNQAKEMAERNLKFRDEDFPYLAATIYPFWRSLIYFSLVRQGQTKYRWKAFTQMRIIEGFVKAGIGNCHYMLMILKAETAAMEFLGSSCQRKTSKLKTLFTVAVRSKQTKDEMSTKIRCMYNDAIKSASKSGFMHGKALANERAGIFASETGGVSVSMRGWDRSYLTEARDLYAEWGAIVKVKQLEDNYAWLSCSDGEPISRASSYIKGRPRFDKRASARNHTTDFFELSSGKSDGDRKSSSSF